MVPVVSVKGSPREIGVQYGIRCREMIRKNVDLYFRVFHHYARLEHGAALQLAKRFIPAIEAFDPTLLEEIKGIAEGAGVEWPEILAINVRTELMYPDQLTGAECTALAALPEATASGDTLIGQNWDWKPLLLETVLLLEIEQPGRPSVVTLTEAGIVGKIGLNSAGLAACLNILKSPVQEVGVPIHILMRGILNCERFGDAIGRIVSLDRGSANNTLIAHRDGAVMDFEMTPKDVEFLYPENGVLVHTNHITAPRLKSLDRTIVQFPDTLLRYGRARQKLLPRAGKISVADFQEIFRDHFNYPDAICRHPNPRAPEVEQVQTIVSIIMNLTQKELHVCLGPPCAGEYQILRPKTL